VIRGAAASSVALVELPRPVAPKPVTFDGYKEASPSSVSLIIVPWVSGRWRRSFPTKSLPNKCRAKASEAGQRPESRTGMVAIVPLWIAGALALGCFVHAQ